MQSFRAHHHGDGRRYVVLASQRERHRAGKSLSEGLVRVDVSASLVRGVGHVQVHAPTGLQYKRQGRRKIGRERLEGPRGHLPLDAQREWGNNAGLADALGMAEGREPFGIYKGKCIGFKGACAQPTTLADIVRLHEEKVGKPLQVFGDLTRPIQSFGVCTGGAPDRLAEAIEDGLDLYVTGEATEWVQAMAEESGVAFIAGGHHNTEVFGARSFACEIASLDGVSAEFINIPNPA